MATRTLTQGGRSHSPETQRNLRGRLGVLGVKIPFSRLRLYCFAVVLVCGLALWRGEVSRRSLFASPNNPQIVENEIDEALQRVATDALGRREGTIIVVDPQTGRVRAVVNPQVAFENSYAPGSTIKPFTALAALRAGLIDKNSTTLCREHYSRQDFSTVCAHTRDLPPFNPSEAIAYSCNYYFGRLGERLNEELLSDTLSSFGFGKPVFRDNDQNHAGQLRRGKVDPRNALGEGDHLQATPIQLIMAYSALVNGGHLLAPRVAASAEFQVSERAQLQIAPEHRAIVIEGLRGAVVYGTAARAGLNSATLDVFGKTGTSSPAKGFRTQGWFVGFAAPPNHGNLRAPADPHLAVLVFLKRAHGADAAALSRGIFEEYERLRDTETRGRENDMGTGENDTGTGRRGDAGTDTGTGRRGDAGTSGESLRLSETELVSPHVPPSPRLPFSVSSSPVLPVSPSGSPRLPVSPSPLLPFSPSRSSLRVHQVRENVNLELSLEDYVLGVVAAEGSMEDQPEALKALAVAARTYAVKNAGRHAREDFDFCTTTHCQRFIAANNRAPLRPAIIDAVKQTEGELMRDAAGQLVDSYFSAACGGVTANLQTLWGANAPAYLRGVRDEFCASMPHHSWTDVISSERLLLALRSDQRTDPGANLKELLVARRDATGRAELILIDGERRRTVNGWDFKIIVGRKLGWNLLKSSRFEVARSGSNFVFRGSGFGHGLGLCQEGGHVMAQRGVSYRQILAKYFPGTSVAERRDAGTGRGGEWATGRGGDVGIEGQRLGIGLLTSNGWQADILPPTSPSPLPPVSPSPRLPFSRSRRVSLSSEHFHVNYPIDAPQRDVEGILKTLESMRANLLRRVSAAGLLVDQFPAPEVFVNSTTGDFVGRTGQPWWAAAATKGNRIELQPTGVLKRRGVLEKTLRHELVHIVIDKLSHGRAPRWLAEGMAIYFAGEGALIARYGSPGKITVEEIDKRLTKASSADEMRKAYAAAYREVSGLVRASSEAGLWRRIAKS
jgi:SpoIID/LytB domain protein